MTHGHRPLIARGLTHSSSTPGVDTEQHGRIFPSRNWGHARVSTLFVQSLVTSTPERTNSCVFGRQRNQRFGFLTRSSFS